jgi:hypothetical protein
MQLAAAGWPRCVIRSCVREDLPNEVVGGSSRKIVRASRFERQSSHVALVATIEMHAPRGWNRSVRIARDELFELAACEVCGHDASRRSSVCAWSIRSCKRLLIVRLDKPNSCESSSSVSSST